jgi:hypothetical protein
MPKCYFAGLMYINGCKGDDQRVLIPDGRNDRQIQKPLDATILVAKEDHAGDTFGGARHDRVLTVDGQPKDFYEFVLKKCSRITVPNSGVAQCFKLDTGLPRAQVAGFVPDLVTPDTIAEIEFNGTVTARSLAGVPIVEWLPGERNDGQAEEPLTITATLLDDDRNPTAETQTLTVRHDASVVFLQSSDVFAEADDDDDDEPKTAAAKEQHERKANDRAALYTKISHERIRVDPDKLAANYEPENPQPDISQDQQGDVLKALRGRPGWLNADTPWCCA